MLGRETQNSADHDVHPFAAFMFQVSAHCPVTKYALEETGALTGKLAGSGHGPKSNFLDFGFPQGFFCPGQK